MQIGMFIFTAVLLGLSYYLHCGLKGNFLNHTPQKEPQLKKYLTRFRNYFAVVGGITFLSSLTTNIAFWLACLLMGCVLAAIFALNFANHL